MRDQMYSGLGVVIGPDPNRGDSFDTGSVYVEPPKARVYGQPSCDTNGFPGPETIYCGGNGFCPAFNPSTSNVAEACGGPSSDCTDVGLAHSAWAGQIYGQIPGTRPYDPKPFPYYAKGMGATSEVGINGQTAVPQA